MPRDRRSARSAQQETRKASGHNTYIISPASHHLVHAPLLLTLLEVTAYKINEMACSPEVRMGPRARVARATANGVLPPLDGRFRTLFCNAQRTAVRGQAPPHATGVAIRQIFAGRSTPERPPRIAARKLKPKSNTEASPTNIKDTNDQSARVPEAVPLNAYAIDKTRKSRAG